MSLAAWQYYKSPRHPRLDRKPKQWDLLKPVAYHRERYCPQAQSLLFQLPAEIRGKIFYYALSPYIDYSKPRQNNQLHSLDPRYFVPDQDYHRKLLDRLHPTHHAGEKYHIGVDGSLLRSCQRVYQEAWWIPFATADLKFHNGFALKFEHRLDDILEIYHRRHSLRLQGRRIEIDHVQIFDPFSSKGIVTVASLPHFYPRCVTLTVGNFGQGQCLVLYPYTHHYPIISRAWLPPSVQEVRLELEASESRHDDLLFLEEMIRATWAFDRVDGTRLLASPDQRLSFYRWINCSARYGQHLSGENTNPFIGISIPFYPLDKDDERAALPLDMPILHSNCLPLRYGREAARTNCQIPEGVDRHDRAAKHRYALSLAKHPFVTRSWVPPFPLPDTPCINYCAGCDYRGAGNRLA